MDTDLKSFYVPFICYSFFVVFSMPIQNVPENQFNAPFQCFEQAIIFNTINGRGDIHHFDDNQSQRSDE